MTKRTQDGSGSRSHGRRWWLPTAAVALVGAVVAWLNQAPWWGWLFVAATVAAAALLSRTWRRRRWFVRGAAWVGVAALTGGVALAAGPIVGTRTLDGPHTDPVTTAQGDVVGVHDASARVDAFAGIPYAAPPVGDLRWEAPQPAPARSETLVADDFGTSVVQAEPSLVTRAGTRVLDLPLEQTLLGGYATDEDSLRLNVWRPSEAPPAPLPVLVYLHGGGFVAGSGALPAYDGTALASTGRAVVVTINYRLGVFGFLDSTALDSTALAGDELGGSTPGNQGLLDQLAALQWVHDNIGEFGGDPGQVTVAGESAGSGAACILGVSPLATGLVHGLIGESGGCLGSAGDRDGGDLYDDAEHAREAARGLSDALGGATLAEMREMPAERIAKAAAAADLATHWWPVVGDAVLPDTPSALYEAGLQNDVPLLLGSNADETSLDLISGVDPDPATWAREARDEYGDDADEFLALYPGGDEEEVTESRIRSGTDQSMTAPMRKWGLTAASSATSPVYPYYFTRVPPDPDLERFGAYHGSEVMYAYSNLGADGDIDYTSVDRRLESEMTGYWLDFATRGDPNGADRERWPTLQEAPDSVLELGDVTSVTSRPSAEAVDFWLRREG